MADEKHEESGAQRELDPKRDARAVEKLKNWDIGTEPDPVMQGLPGKPWWKARAEAKQPKQRDTTDTQKK